MRTSNVQGALKQQQVSNSNSNSGRALVHLHANLNPSSSSSSTQWQETTALKEKHPTTGEGCDSVVVMDINGGIGNIVNTGVFGGMSGFSGQGIYVQKRQFSLSSTTWMESQEGSGETTDSGNLTQEFMDADYSFVTNEEERGLGLSEAEQDEVIAKQEAEENVRAQLRNQLYREGLSYDENALEAEVELRMGELRDAMTQATGSNPDQDTTTAGVTPKVVMDSKGRVYATGKRKNAIARVWIKKGSGKVTINGKPHGDYFPREQHVGTINLPFVVTQLLGQFDVECTVKGGGLSGQAGAIRHGISKALSLYDGSLRASLKPYGLLTRDPRVVERKKAGRKKARKAFQWVKR